MFLPNSLFIYNMAAALRRSANPSLPLRFIQLAIVAFGIKTGLDLARAVEPLALALGGRQLIVAYLHVTLLGFLSMLLMGLVYDLVGGPRSVRAGIWHFALVALGTWGMILALFGAGAVPLFGLVTSAGPRFWMWLALASAWISAAGIYVFALNLRFYPSRPGMLREANSRAEKSRAQPITIQQP
jgi:hypothetical protein